MRPRQGIVLAAILVIMIAAAFTPAFGERSLYVDTAISSEPKGTNKMIRISGKVVDDNRTPVVNAGVSIQVNDPLNSNVHVSFIHTDVNGTYVDSFVLSGLSPAGNYTVYITASKPGFKDGYVQMVFTVVQPSFELAASPVVTSIEPGKPASYNITVSSMSPEEIVVLLSVSGLPNETSYVFSANPIKPSSYATLTIVPSPYTPAGSYNITITGSSSVGNRSINIGLIIKGGESTSDSSIYLVVILLIVAALSGILFYDFRRARRRAQATEAKKADKKYYLDGLPLDSAALMSMPDHLRKTALVLCHMPEATADEIALKTGRARAVESDYLNQLVTLGHIRKRRKGRKVYFFIESKR
ncbi:MAG: hypothetical protein QXF26_04775 [Candidatus Bathyarchaeia archaeon]